MTVLATCVQLPPRAPNGLVPSSWLTAAAAGLLVTPADGGMIVSHQLNVTATLQPFQMQGGSAMHKYVACPAICHDKRTRYVAARQLAAAARVLDLAQQLRGACDLRVRCSHTAHSTVIGSAFHRALEWKHTAQRAAPYQAAAPGSGTPAKCKATVISVTHQPPTHGWWGR
jgi:hypothetical protein